MPRSTFRVALCLLNLFALSPVAFAQLPHTRLYSVFPGGAQAGSTIELKLTGGEDLEEISQIRFSHPGIQGTPKTQMVDGQPQPIENTFDVTVAPDVPPGSYEVYASGYWGLSNPRTFIVGRRAELAEAEPNGEAAQAQVVELGKTINGRADQGTDVDCFKFHAIKGQRIVADCLAARIDSRLAPVLEVFDATGRKLAHARSSRNHDATLVFDAPADGDYLLKVFDQTYRNGQDYLYRLDLHSGPHIAFTLPPAGQAGTTANVRLYGFNLPGGQPTDQKLGRVPLERLDVGIPVPGDAVALNVEGRVSPVESGTDAFSWRLDTAQGPSNPVRIQIGQSAALIEQEPNDLQQPQLISIPADLGGQFATIDDVDAYVFDVKAGDVYWIEVFGERLANEVDPTLIVEHITTEADGKEKVNRLTTQDDLGVNLDPNAFDTQSDDAIFRFAAPANGRCRVILKDRYGETRGDPGLVYRMVIRPESPDFRLVAMPIQAGLGQSGSTTLRKGEDFTFHVVAFRRDGFNEAIEVRAEGLPPGVSSTGTIIGPNQTLAVLAVSTSADAPDSVANVRLVGRAVVHSPALVQVEQAARGALDAGQKAIADIRKAAATESQKLEQATATFAASLKSASEKPGDAAAQGQLAEAQKQLEAVQGPQKAAIEKLLAAEKGLVDQQAALTQAHAASEAGAIPVEHDARIATVVWANQNNKPAFTRIARELPVGVMKEAAAYQVRPEVAKAEVRQGGLVLVPVKLDRRSGFDGEVQIAINGRPNNSNIDGQNFKFDKDKSEFLLPLFVKENSAPDTYAVYFTGTAQVPHRRNPEKADRIKAEFDAQAAIAKAAQDEAQKTEQVKNDATQKAVEAGQKAELAEQVRQKAATDLPSVMEAAKQAGELKLEAEKKSTDAAAAAAKAEEDLAAAKKELDADAASEALKQKVAAAEQVVATAKTAAEEAAKALTDAAAKSTEAETVLATATEALKTAEQAAKEAVTAKAAADEAKVAAENADTAAKAKAKTEEEKRQQAEKRSNDAAQVAAVKNLNYVPNSAPVVIVVRPAPVKLSASAANSGQLKRGEKLEIKTTITRQNTFAGPVTLTLALPPGVSGLAADPVTVAADKNEGVLTVTAAADATEGELKNIVVRSQCEFEGPAAVDAPVTIKVMP